MIRKTKLRKKGMFLVENDKILAVSLAQKVEQHKILKTFFSLSKKTEIIDLTIDESDEKDESTKTKHNYNENIQIPYYRFNPYGNGWWKRISIVSLLLTKNDIQQGPADR